MEGGKITGLMHTLYFYAHPRTVLRYGTGVSLPSKYFYNSSSKKEKVIGSYF